MAVTSEIVRELLHYDPINGIFTWAYRGEHWFESAQRCHLWNAQYADKRAGSVQTNNKGYKHRVIRLLGFLLKESRLAWLYMSDEPLPAQIDHKNRNGTDNRWVNLRPTSYGSNNRNKSIYSNNTSGISGVSWNKKCSRWMAQCMIKGRNNFLGHFEDKHEAGRAVSMFRASHGFDPGHGKYLPYKSTQTKTN